MHNLYLIIYINFFLVLLKNNFFLHSENCATQLLEKKGYHSFIIKNNIN